MRDVEVLEFESQNELDSRGASALIRTPRASHHAIRLEDLLENQRLGMLNEVVDLSIPLDSESPLEVAN